MAQPAYVFRPMSEADLPLVKRWLAEPHVMQWWGDTYEQFEIVRGDLEVEAMDQFIGELDMIDRGHGSAFIRSFIDRLLAGGASRVITDPDPANARAIRAYEKAGFCRDRLVETPGGAALLMV